LPSGCPRKGIAYRYDERFRIIDGYAIRPDFYLPEYDVYIEYWGMDTADYKIGMLKKQKLYQETGKRLVSVYFQEFDRIRGGACRETGSVLGAHGVGADSTSLRDGEKVAVMYPKTNCCRFPHYSICCFASGGVPLIHVEQVWAENRLTAEGRMLHERAHEAAAEWRGGVRIVRGLRLRSLALGLIGVADVVEFRDADRGGAVAGARWRPFPVEYKRGKPKANACDEVQLCAQAMCLEEMLECSIADGALFYGKTRRRKDVAFTMTLAHVGGACRCPTAHAGGRRHHATGAVL
jgi:CRISPR-associated protein Cas4